MTVNWQGLVANMQPALAILQRNLGFGGGRFTDNFEKHRIKYE